MYNTLYIHHIICIIYFIIYTYILLYIHTVLCLTECLLILGILHFSFYVWPRFHWDYEQHTNPDAKVNPTLHDSWKWHDDE